MSIADMLQQVAENVPKVYEAGYDNAMDETTKAFDELHEYAQSLIDGGAK